MNVDWFFVLHRLPVALAAQREGYEVHIAAAITDYADVFLSKGMVVHGLSLDRKSTNIRNNLNLFWQFVVLLRRLRPDLVHLVTIKPATLGGIAARIAGVRAVVAAVSGLGFVFVARGWKHLLLRTVVASAYRLAFGKKNLRVIFENPDDCDVVRRLAKLSDQKITISRAGVGVDLSRFKPAPFPEGAPVILMASRLLVDKGVREFVEAARFLRQRKCVARFCLAGSLDTENPSSISNEELAAWVGEGVIELWGYQDDMPAILNASHIVVLPSYREGLPRILLEAAACGRPVVTTDVPGCRHVVRHGDNGILVAPRNALALADALMRLVLNRPLREEMGKRGREIAEAEFSIERVIQQTLAVYRELLA